MDRRDETPRDDRCARGTGLSAAQQRFFGTFGYLVLPRLFGPAEVRVIEVEFERAMRSERIAASAPRSGGRHARLLMSDETPTIAGLADDDRLAGAARQLVRGEAICAHVSGACHRGRSGWHSDNLDLPYSGVKMMLYMDRLRRSTGALRVLPGSHRAAGRADRLLLFDARSSFGMDPAQLPGEALATDPGDVIAFCHPLWHASFGARGMRRVVELNYYRNPRTPAEVGAFVAQMRRNHAAAAEAGISMYPASWRRCADARHRGWVRRLKELGVLNTPGIRP